MGAISVASYPVTFLFPSFRRLKRELGALDAVSEWIELAVRDFADRVGERGELLEQMSSKHGVRVNSSELPRVRAHVVAIYLAAVHDRLGEFLLELRLEHPTGDKWDMSGDESRLTRVTRSVGLERTLSFEICEYYRAARNALLHHEVRKKTGRADLGVASLAARVRSTPEFTKLDAPNPLSRLSFDDFVLFTRCTKILGRELCEAARPTAAELSAIALKHAQARGLTGKLAKSPARLSAALSGFLQTEYSLSREEADNIVERPASLT